MLRKMRSWKIALQHLWMILRYGDLDAAAEQTAKKWKELSDAYKS